MGIQDDYFDIREDISSGLKRNTLIIFERFANWAFSLEVENNVLREKIKELEITVKNISKLLQR